MKAAALGLAMAIALTSSVPASADDWPSSGAFDVVEVENGCAMAGEFAFDGRSDVKFFLVYAGADLSISFTSLDWSKAADDTEVAYLFLDGSRDVADGFTASVKGITLDTIYDGFVAKFTEDVLPPFAHAASLFVRSGDTTITHINLRGSAAAVETLRRCKASVERRESAQAAAERRFDYIERDPFSPPASDGSSVGVDEARPSVLTNPTWASPIRADFPERALSREIRNGSVSLECTVSANGSVSSCTILSETPAGAGFGASALSAARRARLSPASVDALAAGGRVRFTVPFEAH